MDKKGVILTVADEDELLKLLDYNFTYEYEWVYANTAPEALNVIANKKVNVILLDIEAKKADGFKLLSTMRKQTKAQVIIISSYCDEYFLRKAIESGAESVITKPFNKEALTEKIAELAAPPKVILAIDDLPLQLRTYQQYLVPKYDLRTATSVKEGIAYLLKSKADLILLDLDMPEMDGFSFIVNIKNIIPTMNTPIIVISGRKEEDFAAQINANNAISFLPKPVTQDALIKSIKKVLALNKEKPV